MRFRKNHAYLVRRGYAIHPVQGSKAHEQAADEAGEEADEEGDETGEQPSQDKGQKLAAKTFTQEEVNAILAKEKEKLKRAEERKKQEEQEKALAEQKKFEELANQRKAALDEAEAARERAEQELEAAKEEAARYAAMLQKIAEQAKKGLDKSVLALLDKLPLDEQLAWITENVPQQGNEEKGSKSTPLTPRGSGAGKTAQEEERRKAVARQYRRTF